MKRRVAIVGSRKFQRVGLVLNLVDSLVPGSVVISGGARGVDELAEDRALKRGLGVVSYRPYLKDAVDRTYGIKKHVYEVDGSRTVEEIPTPRKFKTFEDAAFYRNTLIIDDADETEAFWDGSSTGTEHGINYTKSVGKSLNVTKDTVYVCR